jgi:hypothetical protein
LALRWLLKEGRVGSAPNSKATSADIAACIPMAEGVLLVERKANISQRTPHAGNQRRGGRIVLGALSHASVTAGTCLAVSIPCHERLG